MTFGSGLRTVRRGQEPDPVRISNADVRLTAQEEYGLRCILQVARTPEATPIVVAEIARHEALTHAYTGKLMRVLMRARLVVSTRGCRGGYQLARPAEEISVSEVLRALGWRLYSDDFCTRYTGTDSDCVHTVDCAIRSLWSGLDGLLHDLLARCKLSDLLCNEHTMNGWLQTSMAQHGTVSLPALPKRYPPPTLARKLTRLEEGQ